MDSHHAGELQTGQSSQDSQLVSILNAVPLANTNQWQHRYIRPIRAELLICSIDTNIPAPTPLHITSSHSIPVGARKHSVNRSTTRYGHPALLNHARLRRPKHPHGHARTRSRIIHNPPILHRLMAALPTLDDPNPLGTEETVSPCRRTESTKSDRKLQSNRRTISDLPRLSKQSIRIHTHTMSPHTYPGPLNRFIPSIISPLGMASNIRLHAVDIIKHIPATTTLA